MRRAVRLPLEALSPYLLELAVPETSVEAAEARPLDWQTVFGNDRPVEIEVGFGKGLFLVSTGAVRTDTNFLGIEIERKYTLYVANRLAKRQLRNVRVVCGDARSIFERQVLESSVQALHVYFPDPWWKKKHRKRRLFTDEFAEACVRVLRTGGQFHIVSDVEEYFSEITQLLSRHDSLKPQPPLAPSQPQHDFDYLTNFERKYRLEGRAIYRALYLKT